MDDPAAGLRRQVRRWRGEGEREPAGVDLEPASAYEVVTRQMVEQLGDDLREIKERLNNLLWMIAAAILLDIVIRLAGLG